MYLFTYMIPFKTLYAKTHATEGELRTKLKNQLIEHYTWLVL